jgi:hypothetical protein
MKKLLPIMTLLLIIVAMMASCSGKKFKIEGRFDDGGSQNIRIVYVGDSGVSAQWVPMVNGLFKFEGSSGDMTVVYIFDQMKRRIAHIAIENGDHVKLRGKMAEPYKIKMKGTGINERWSEFLNDNAKAFGDGNNYMTDIAIESYIRKNNDDVVSTLLLLNDYSTLANTKKIDKLLATIDKDAKPESLMRSYNAMLASQHATGAGEVRSLSLFSSRDSIEVLNPSNSKVTLLYFWSNDDNMHKLDIEAIKTFANKYKGTKDVQIADILMEGDSTMWKSKIKADGGAWLHYWAVGGPMNNSIQNLQINSTPCVIVANSQGRQLYHGNSAIDACNTAMANAK